MAPVSVSLLDGTPDGAALGEFLRQARERRGLTLQQISSETKIPWRHLDALEHGRLNAVPAGPYRRGEIRAYADVVGLDQALALEWLDRALQASTALAAPVPRPPSPASRRGQSLLTVTLIALAAATALTLWNRVAVTRSSAPWRIPPLTAGRTLAPSTLLPLPIVQPDIPLVEADTAPVGELPATTVRDTATPPARLDAELTITSQPSGARVTVDGIARGVTPVTVRHLAPGDRRIRITMTDFTAVERSVQMPDDRSSTSLHFVLTPSSRQ